MKCLNHGVFDIQVLEVLQTDLNLNIINLLNIVRSYNSSLGLTFTSFSFSFNLQNLLPTNEDILTDIQNALSTNEGDIIPDGFELTERRFEVMEFYSSCEYWQFNYLLPKLLALNSNMMQPFLYGWLNYQVIMQN